MNPITKFFDWLFDYRVLLPNDQRERSMWVLGLPGSGKSRALESWILQDALAGRGCGFLDPAADSFNSLLHVLH